MANKNENTNLAAKAKAAADERRTSWVAERERRLEASKPKVKK